MFSQAMTHPSAVATRVDSNQRLEFLGDAVLGSVVADLMYKQERGAEEGQLTRARICVVRGSALASLARELRLSGLLVMSEAVERAGGRLSAGQLEDAMEALIGAVYLRRGYEATKRWLSDVLRTRVAACSGAEAAKAAASKTATGKAAKTATGKRGAAGKRGP